MTTKYDKEVKRREQLEKQIEEFKATLEDSEELELLSKELEKQEETNKSLNAELAKYKEVDPEIFKLKRKFKTGNNNKGNSILRGIRNCNCTIQGCYKPLCREYLANEVLLCKQVPYGQSIIRQHFPLD